MFFFYKSDLDETFNQSLTDFCLINHLTIYRANIEMKLYMDYLRNLKFSLNLVFIACTMLL